MAENNPPHSGVLWARSLQTWLEAWIAFAAPSAVPGDPFQLWQQSFDQWLAGWGAFFDETLTTPEAAAAGGRVLDTILNIEKPTRERTATFMQYWLEFFNMPTRSDVIRLAVNVNDANARLDELQELVESLGDQVAELSGRGTRAEQPLGLVGGAA